MGSSGISVLLMDDSQMHRDMLIVGMSRELIIKIKAMSGNVNELLNKIDMLQGYEFAIVSAASKDKSVADNLIEKAQGKGVQIAILADYAKDNIVKSKSAVYKRPIIGDILGFGQITKELIAFIKKEPVKPLEASFMAERKRTWFSENIYNELKKIADKKITDKVLRDYVIAVGSSTGGTEALKAVLHNLPLKVPPIVIVQHMPPVFTKMFSDRLNTECKVSVKEGESGDILLPGKVFVAPGDKHMRVIKTNKGYEIECSGQEKVGGHCPAVNVLFESVANVFGANAIGVILTGMGRDGADTLLKMRRIGAVTIGQDEDSCVVYGMPKAAFDIGAVQKQLPITQIAAELISTLAGISGR